MCFYHTKEWLSWNFQTSWSQCCWFPHVISNSRRSMLMEMPDLFQCSYPHPSCWHGTSEDSLYSVSCFFRNISDVLWEAISTGRILSLYQGLGTKNLQSFISQFVYFYGYSFFKRLYLRKSGNKSMGMRANLIVASAAGACTVIVTQVVNTGCSWV